MKWCRGKVMYLIRRIDSKVLGVKVLVYNNNSNKAFKIKRPLQLTVPLEIDSLGNIEQSRSHCIDPTYEYYRPRREAAKDADTKQNLIDI